MHTQTGNKPEEKATTLEKKNVTDNLRKHTHFADFVVRKLKKKNKKNKRLDRKNISWSVGKPPRKAFSSKGKFQQFIQIYYWVLLASTPSTDTERRITYKRRKTLNKHFLYLYVKNESFIFIGERLQHMSYKCGTCSYSLVQRNCIQQPAIWWVLKNDLWITFALFVWDVREKFCLMQAA